MIQDKKALYEAPTLEIIGFQFEDSIAESGELEGASFFEQLWVLD